MMVFSPGNANAPTCGMCPWASEKYSAANCGIVVHVAGQLSDTGLDTSDSRFDGCEFC
jgi:hypothetical protein